jgi:hypothetical protein
MSGYAAVMLRGKFAQYAVDVEGSGITDEGSAALAAMSKLVIDPLTKIAERIGVEAVDTATMGDGVYLGSADGKRLYSWPDVVDKLVSRIESQPIDYDVLARRMVSIAMAVPLNEVSVLKPDHHEYITSAVSSLCEVLPGVSRDEVYEQVKSVIAELHRQVHEDLERGDAEGSAA